MTITEKNNIPRTICPLIFLIDTSRYMSGTPMAAVNREMNILLQELVDVNNDFHTSIKLGILAFGVQVGWLTGPELVDPETFTWKELIATGENSIGKAFAELNHALSHINGMMAPPQDSLRPILILLSTSEPSDGYQGSLEDLRSNPWFSQSSTIAVDVTTSNSALSDFVESANNVDHTDQFCALGKRIKHLFVNLGFHVREEFINYKHDTDLILHSPDCFELDDEEFW